ncbi:MAG: class I SAM-dependent methyltransferase [Candidatus Pelagibacter sp. TMED153]|nr:MAG: class I SAM-dependent methyltransferase [Candidatus Pelagibacter sp. TMED153]|tara:strand:- start:2697 stop:3461 length:765 start_codon:yes stop_codon:yes gene_type:complete
MLNANEFLSELYSRLDAGNPLYNKGQIHIDNFKANEIANYYIHQYASILPSNKDIKILDIGVGEGWFASICYKLGYQHIELADFGCKLKFSEIKESLNEVKALHDVETSIKDMLQQDKFEDQYDFIHMSHVIEHIPKYDLIATMDALNNALRRQGQLFIRTPNLLGPIPFNSLYCTAGHEYGFVPSNLEQFFQISNFDNMKIHDLEIPPRGFSQKIGRVLRNLYMLNEKIKYRVFEGVYPKSVRPELIMSGYKK